MNGIGFCIGFISVLITGLNAGFFYTWSFTIMHSLDLIDANHAISAMQSINANIRNGWFAAIFFGAAVVQFVALVFALLSGKRMVAVCIVLALMSIMTCIGITMQLHVPWNNDLADTVITGVNAATLWAAYSPQWTLWNHVRTLASTGSFIMMLIALSRWNRA